MKNILLLLLISASVYPGLLFADPGEDAAISVCVQDDPFDLLDALNGSPLPGGTWSDPDGQEVVDGVFTPGESVEGDYTYTIDSGDGPESSVVSITSVNCTGSPQNNACSSAQFVNPALNIPFSTFGATTDGLAHPGEENCEIDGEAQIENDVWFLYLASCDGEATVTTVGGTDLDTKIAVYSFGCPPSTDLLLGCDDNFGETLQSTVVWQVEQDEVYLIRIGESPGPGSGNGTFNLTESCGGQDPPENDDCEMAELITPQQGIPFSTFNAITDGPDHAGDATCFLSGDTQFSNDIWYTYTASCDGSATMTTVGGTNSGTRLAVYSGGCPQDLSGLIACNDDYQGFAQSLVSWEVSEGVTYTLRLGNPIGSGGGEGTFDLLENCGLEPPVNDDCNSAQIIDPMNGIPFNTLNATTDGPSHFGNNTCNFFGGTQIEKDVWYEYTAGCDGTAEVSTVGGTFLDTRLAVYAADCPQNLLNLVVCNDDDGSLQSTVLWNVAEGDTYIIRLGEFPGEGGGSGTFNLVESCNEICVLPVVGYEMVCNGLDDFDSFYINAHVFNMGNSNSYSITPNIGTGSLTFDQPGVYEFGPYDNETVVSFELQSLTDGTCSESTSEMTQDCYPDNINFSCDDVEEIFANQYTSYTAENSFNAGEPIDEPFCAFEDVNNDLWFVYSAPCTGEATWTNCAMSTAATHMVVYENTCENDDLEVVACSQPDECNEFSSSVTFSTFQNGSYVMRLGTAAASDFGMGVFIVEQEIDLVTAGSDSTVSYCTSNTSSVLLNGLLDGADTGGQWSDADSSGALIGNVLFLNSLDGPGTYDFVYSINGPCNSDEVTITVIYDICKDVDITSPKLFSLYPNPAQNFVRIRTNAPTSTVGVTIFDVSGRNVLNEQFNLDANSSAEIDLDEGLVRGIYFVQIVDAYSNHRETHKLILN